MFNLFNFLAKKEQGPSIEWYGEEIHLGRSVHLSIDQQFQEVVYSNQRSEIAKKVSHFIVPSLNDQNIPTYWVWYDSARGFHEDQVAGGSIYEFNPGPNDKFIEKSKNDAFKGSNIEKHLKKDSIDTLIVTGFNHGACVKETVLSACKKGYNVFVLTDGTDYYYTEHHDSVLTTRSEMEQVGALFISSEDLIQKINRAQKAEQTTLPSQNLPLKL